MKTQITTLAIILAASCMLVGLVFTLVIIVMFMAGGANSTATKIHQTQWMIASVVVVQLLSLGSSIALLIFKQGWIACGAGLVPAAYAIALVSVLVHLEW